ncbi:hypothetical protein CSV75_04625 [Sporosarcina sp. P18a]|uniref:hypothetical protein n=1 Tax=Sporosarcina sp. P18a TaxID=2048259 RepID=UPI000C171D67|nr:hypothetical protein [Sporosarcina sp. P18a]PIC81068.1 hypothetical protein CSV75_04625 [Sporosarcina sp. P18a]
MDFEKIKSEALREFTGNKVIDFLKETDNSNPFNLPPDEAEGVENNKLMIRLAFEASSIAIEKYHEQLSLLLKEKGINLDDLD